MEVARVWYRNELHVEYYFHKSVNILTLRRILLTEQFALTLEQTYNFISMNAGKKHTSTILQVKVLIYNHLFYTCSTHGNLLFYWAGMYTTVISSV